MTPTVRSIFTLSIRQVDPFDPDSPIKKGGITTFPGDLFFVLRVVQLLRGLASGELQGPSEEDIITLAILRASASHT